MNFFVVALIWIAFFAVTALLILIFGDAFEYILSLAGLAILFYTIFFSRGSYGGDDSFPEPSDFD